MLPSPSSLCLLHDRPRNPRDKMFRQGRDFNEGTRRQRRWQVRNSKLLSYWGLDVRLFYRSERKKQRGTKVKQQNREGDPVGAVK